MRLASTWPLAFTVSAKVRDRFSSIVRSAPPENASLPEVTTAPLIAGSVATCSMIWPISFVTSSVKTFIERPGLSQVMSAMPSASTSTLKLTQLIARLPSLF